MATIDAYGLLDPDFVLQLRRAVAKAPASEELNLRIASPGGQLAAGVTAYNVLRNAPNRVTAVVDGDAFSAASLLVCAADYAEMPSNALMMIHDPWLGFQGPLTIEESQRINTYLSATKNQAIEIYRAKTHAARDRLAQQMFEETYFTADEALAEGFVNNVIGESRTIQNRPVDDYTARDKIKLAQALSHRRIPRDVQSLLNSIGIE